MGCPLRSEADLLSERQRTRLQSTKVEVYRGYLIGECICRDLLPIGMYDFVAGRAGHHACRNLKRCVDLFAEHKARFSKRVFIGLVGQGL